MNLVVILIVSLLFYAFFSGMEIAYVSSNRIHFLAEDKKQHGFIDKILSVFRKNSSQFIYTLLTGNIIALLVYGVVSAQLLAPLASSIWNNLVFIIFFQISVAVCFLFFVAEFFPKILFRINPDLHIRIFAIPTLFFYYLLYPVSWLFSNIAIVFFKLFRFDVTKRFQKANIGKGYLDYYIQRSIDDLPEDATIETEVKLFQNALDFSTVKLRNCIVPRTEIVAADKSTSKEELTLLFIETGYSKIIVYEEDLDNIVGYIHSAEMFKHTDEWVNFINQIPIVPETMIAIELMNKLMQEKKSIAVVVDEFGGTTGIVTLEDLVEEIFGDIEDEHDSQSFLAKKIGENEYIFAGRNEVDKINEQFDLDLPESDNYITLAGLILDFYQKFPKINEEIQIGKFIFTIVRISSTKIELVKLSVMD